VDGGVVVSDIGAVWRFCKRPQSVYKSRRDSIVVEAILFIIMLALFT